MGQINSSQDLESLQSSGGNNVRNEAETQQQKDANSEQVRCVKTRIDMLIEDCLNTKESSVDSDAEKSRNVENIETKSAKESDKDCEENVKEEEKGGDKESAGRGVDVSESKDGENAKSENCEKDGKCNKHNKHECKECSKDAGKVVEEEKTVKNEGIKLNDLITDMVQTELTQKQLKQIQQRTITTFNTFIDKVLDNSLNQETSSESKPKPSNILKLCSESMIPSTDKKSEDSPGDVEVNEKPECDRDIDKPKRISLKDHIERFLEMNFRDENINEEKKAKDTKNTNVQENFNAQGLVDSMITQGIQINRLLTTKEQQQKEHKGNVSKEMEMYSKQSRSLEHNMKQQHQQPPPPPPQQQQQLRDDRYRQRSPNSSSMRERADSRGQQSMSNYQAMEAKYRGHYLNVAAHRNSQGYPRRDEMMEREMHTKMNVGSLKGGDRMSAFHQQHVMPGSNSAYFGHPYGPRMQLSPGQLRETINARGDSKQVIHMRDCMCAMCVHQHNPRHSVESGGMEHHPGGKRSPNIPHPIHPGQPYPPGLVREVPALMRPTAADLPPGMIQAYQGMHKLLPHHSPITSTKVYPAGQLLTPADISAQAMINSRQMGTPDSGHSHLGHYQSRRNEEMFHSSHSNDRPNIRSGKQSPYSTRPSSVPSQDHSNLHHPRPGSGHRFYESEYVRNSDSSSCTSDCSTEAPLDLTVKKSKHDQMRGRSQSNGSAVKKIQPSNSFIKHLESSVDRYWQELNSPPTSPIISAPATPLNRSHSPVNNRNPSHLYSQQSPNGSSPAGLLGVLQNRPLPSPHYTGGITVGQPLVDLKSHGTQKQTEYQSGNIPQTGPQAMYSQIPHPSQGRQSNYEMNSKMNKMPQEQVSFQGNQTNVDLASKKSSNNVSKHEPIQNIIGNHDPNDILYLICRLCTQTYGSPYGFRKHFRNQHGFEPRAEHTIVQTISATKTALHLPQSQLIQSMPDERESRVMCKSVSPESDRMCSASNVPSKSVSPMDTKSLTGSEEGSDKLDNSETKCLECPKCGKSFQLNDFGSYKRHCRQHGNVKMNGPFSCTDCHLPFPDQKSLREHYITHVKDGSGMIKPDQKNEGNGNKVESHPTFYVCVKCDKQYENVDSYNFHMSTHGPESKNKNTNDLVGIVKTEQKSASPDPVNTVSASIVMCETVIKQEAESNTAIACPDSSWDDEGKGDVTSNKPNSVSDSRDSTDTNTRISIDQTNSEDKSKENSPARYTSQISVDTESSESEKKEEEDTSFMYKHKKFFHHRKRAISSQSESSSDVSNVKQAKMNSGVPTNVVDKKDLPPSSSSSPSGKLTCDSTANSESNSSDKSVTDDSLNEKMAEKNSEKPVKTEARHSLPFVWDRTTRSQKKL